ncbi:Uma2 family endonuclease [Methylomonas sp. BW4-1]|uniref:Uma2 family endonuclease n=1 Tax=unclassified Methylomonas TaxID=2608980 RepID=UPI00051C8BD5|nr:MULTISPECIES: Uma2 family endonuclease [unclassified Methylomonas]PKD39754.1 Uma2 family endonuclease [Methylomonas sp. Kb3]QBC29378.1 Uma2 family endonuclease [Methylomonas sp. LW13]
MQTAERLHFSAEDYLAWEATQAEKHEFVAGEVFAMTGARQDHVVVSLNIASALKQRLRGTFCRPYIADLKLKVEAAEAFFYPDVMVSCHPGDLGNQQYISNPTLIVEVLSDSTAAYDRGGKFAAYRKLASLQEYLIVDIDARRVECFRRTAENDWLLHDYIGDVDCQLHSLSLSLPLAEIFEDIETT